MVEPDVSFDEIAQYCGLAVDEVIRWAEQGALVSLSGCYAPDSRVTLSALMRCLDSKGLAIPDDLRAQWRRVLIVDDERPMAQAIQRVLRRAGFETFVADDGFTAGRLLERLDPSPTLVTLDLTMPGLHGLDVVRFIRHQPRFQALKILVISALPDDQLQRARNLGADAVLSKPFHNRELQAVISTLLEEHPVAEKGEV